MACKLCESAKPLSNPQPCRHEVENSKPTLMWRDSTPEIEALVSDMQNVLSVAKQRGIAKKHLDEAYKRGFQSAVKEATNAIRHVHAID